MLTYNKERKNLINRIKFVKDSEFDSLALDIFSFQSRYCHLYRQYLDLLGKHPDRIYGLEEIPFLPIQLFKNHQIQTGQWSPEKIFLSSGTTGQTPSKHFIKSLDWYHFHSLKAFENIYGSVRQYSILALLPSYLERSGSSLVYMVEHFMKASGHQNNNFFLQDHLTLKKTLLEHEANGVPTLLIGVSFALLDFAETHAIPLNHTIIMETGGMKGKRAELTRSALHRNLKSAFQVDHIHSEYGMTELLSQAYAPQGGRFIPAPTMRTQIHALTDPFEVLDPGKRGTLSIIDLANLDSISFIATQDIGVLHSDRTFEVLGRVDQSEIRGCNLMIE